LQRSAASPTAAEHSTPSYRWPFRPQRFRPRPELEEGVRSMRVKVVLALAAVTALSGAGAAIANHVAQVDPAAVPTGFLAAHNSIADVPIEALVRAANPDGADVFVQHVRLPANVSTGWHTHPGPALVEVVNGSLTYEDAKSAPARAFSTATRTPA